MSQDYNILDVLYFFYTQLVKNKKVIVPLDIDLKFRDYLNFQNVPYRIGNAARQYKRVGNSYLSDCNHNIYYLLD